MVDGVRFVSDVLRELLDVDDVAGANFFEAGGDSLIALEVASRYEEQSGREFPLELMFETGDIDDVLAEVSRHESP